MSNIKEIIESGKAFLGIEFGSTRIKAVLIDEEHNPIASGSHTWENRYENGLWTYSLDDIWTKKESFLHHSRHGETAIQERLLKCW